jgi:hypothetical protein
MPDSTGFSTATESKQQTFIEIAMGGNNFDGPMRFDLVDIDMYTFSEYIRFAHRGIVNPITNAGPMKLRGFLGEYMLYIGEVVEDAPRNALRDYIAVANKYSTSARNICNNQFPGQNY